MHVIRNYFFKQQILSHSDVKRNSIESLCVHENVSNEDSMMKSNCSDQHWTRISTKTQRKNVAQFEILLGFLNETQYRSSDRSIDDYY